MSKLTLLEESTEDLLEELHRRISDGKVQLSLAITVMHAIIAAEQQKLSDEQDKTMDLEVALVAGLGKKTAMYGTENREQFIANKLKKWEGKLRFNFNLPTTIRKEVEQ